MAATPDLLPRLAAFARLLHDAGLDAGPGRLTTATRALGMIEIRDAVAFRDSLRACFVSRRDELALFEAAFDIFWAPPDPGCAPGWPPRHRGGHPGAQPSAAAAAGTGSRLAAGAGPEPLAAAA